MQDPGESRELSRLVAAPLAAGELGGPSDDFVIVEWSDSGHGEWEWIAPLHVHHADDEAWYVLEGRAELGGGADREAGGATRAGRSPP